jgi:phosphoglycerate dehydrogenase-like enzyme
MKVAILDDYQNVALQCADWSGVAKRAHIDVFTDHVAEADAVVARLRPYDILAVMRERTPLRRDILERLPNLKMIASNAPRNASIDMTAAAERGIAVTHSSYSSTPTVELTWALILAGARHIVAEASAVRRGQWQHTIGDDLAEKTLGILGLGSIGTHVAKVAQAFGMKVIAWSQNLTADKAAAHGATLVSKEELFRRADVLSIHLVLSDRTRGLVGAPELSLMKASARLVNTSRGPIVVEAALIEALSSGRIAGAAIDVYDIEPLPVEHPYRKLDRLLATPHIGYVSRGLYERFYRDMAANIAAWLESAAPAGPRNP